MKKFLLAISALLAAGTFSASAETTSAAALKEAFSFEKATPVTVGVCTYEKDMGGNGTTYSGQVEIAGWDIPANGDAKAGGVFLTGSGAWLGGKGYDVPATNFAGEADAKVMGVIAVWEGTVQYTLPVELAPNEYTLTMQIYNKKGGTSDFVKNLIGFVAEDGTEYLSTAKGYAVDTWTNESVTFNLTAATKGYISIGFESPNSGSGANQHLFIDGLALHYKGEPTADKTALEAAIAAAEAKVLGFEAGEYAPYNNADALKALDAAKALVGITVYEQETVDAATAALTGATWTENEAELNAIYNGNFWLSQPDAPAPYWSDVTTGGFGNSRVFVYTKPNDESSESEIKNFNSLGALQDNDSIRAALYLRYYENPGAWYNYGSTSAAYSMPLKKDVEYVFSVDFGQWGEGDGNNNIQILDAAGTVVFEAMNLASDHLDTEGAKATHVSGTFKPTVDGNCRLSLWSPGEKKHYNVFSNFKIVKAPSRADLFGNYTVDSLVGQERNWVSSDNEWHALELKNYAASLAPTAMGDTIILQGLLSDDNLLYGVLNIAEMEIEFYPQAVDVVNHTDLVFCSQGDYAKGVVATIDPELNITFNGWTVVNTADSTVYIKDVECTLSKGFPEYKDQTITWDQTFEEVAINTPITLEATASSGLEVVYELVETSIATLEGNVLTFTEEGEVTVKATQPGNSYYKAAEPVEKKITAKAAGLESVAADNEVPVYYNLQGIEVKNPQQGQIIVVVRGGKATKTLVK